ncbi:hypothetical protein AK830_g11102 [Neonectria ditissima]|uniref:Uncharacterized protein n=1 Tax=Neonectria ditissima TaxID=78410 RepID=A0A0P7B268_9HYPO|nr:hypothetical protein AK830_g11102 [Neonectria ditissima]
MECFCHKLLAQKFDDITESETLILRAWVSASSSTLQPPGQPFAPPELAIPAGQKRGAGNSSNEAQSRKQLRKTVDTSLKCPATQLSHDKQLQLTLPKTDVSKLIDTYSYEYAVKLFKGDKLDTQQISSEGRPYTRIFLAIERNNQKIEVQQLLRRVYCYTFALLHPKGTSIDPIVQEINNALPHTQQSVREKVYNILRIGERWKEIINDFLSILSPESQAIPWKYIEPRLTTAKLCLPHLRYTLQAIQEGLENLPEYTRTDLALTLVEACRFPTMKWKEFAIAYAKTVAQGINDEHVRCRISQSKCLLYRLGGDMDQALGSLRECAEAGLSNDEGKRLHSVHGLTAVQSALNSIQKEELATAEESLEAWTPLSQIASPMEEVVLFRKHMLLGKVLRYAGRFEESLAHLKAAQKLALDKKHLDSDEDLRNGSNQQVSDRDWWCDSDHHCIYLRYFESAGRTEADDTGSVPEPTGLPGYTGKARQCSVLDCGLAGLDGVFAVSRCS